MAQLSIAAPTGWPIVTPKVQVLKAGQVFESEAKLEDWLVLRFKEKGERVSRQVVTRWGRLDFATRELLVECKHELTPANIAQAFGQLFLYSRFFPEKHCVIAGFGDKAKLDPELLKRVLKCGISIWIISSESVRKRAARSATQAG